MTPLIHQSFAAGEISPALFGQVSLAKVSVAATTLRNMTVSYRGGAYSRAGSAYVLPSKQQWTSGTQPRLITFQFNVAQGYALELGEHYMRFIYQGAPILEATKAITGITQANPGVLHVVAHGYTSGDWVFLEAIGGMTQLNNRFFIVSVVDADHFSLISLFTSTGIDTTLYGAYTTGGFSARIYTLATPWAASDLPLLKFTQSADVMSFTHPSYPSYDLARIAANNWTLAPVVIGSVVTAPGIPVLLATVHPSGATSPPTLPCAYAYVVTAVDAQGNESVASAVANVTDSVDMAVTAGSIVIDWPAAPNAVTYNIYRAPTSYNTDPGNPAAALPVPLGAIFSYVGTSYGAQFIDSNTIPDTTKVPPLHLNPFAPGRILLVRISSAGSGYTSAGTTVAISTGTGSGFVGIPVIISGAVVAIIIQDAGRDYLSGDTLVITDSGGGTGATGTLSIGPPTGTYPGAVAYYQQRRVYAATLNNPDTYFMSKPGEFLNFDTAIPTEASDAITGTPWSQQVNGIQWMIPEPGGLVVMTGKGAWQVTGQGGSAINPQPITPSSQQAQPQTFSGCSPVVPPITINSDILYVQAKGSAVRDMVYNYFTNNYTGNDQTVLSGHLFTGFTIHEWAWCEEPYKIIWAVRNDGVLLSFTYLKEQEVFGWARHDTQGRYVSVTSVSEVTETERADADVGVNNPLVALDALYAVVERFTPNGPVFFIERTDDRLWETVEQCWCVDCGLQYPQTEGTVSLYATTATGPTAIIAASGIFNGSETGQVLRIGGGIALVTGYSIPTLIYATWVLPPSGLVPGVTGSVQFLEPTSWSIVTPIRIVGGLEHLAGMAVVGLADGIPVGPLTVGADGTVDIGFMASFITLGLAFTAQVQSPYLDAGNPTVQGRRKNIIAVTARVEASLDAQVGSNQPDGSVVQPPQIAPTWSGMQPAQSVDEAFVSTTYTSVGGQIVTNLFTGDVRAPVPADWQVPGQIAVQQTKPLPLNLLALIPEVLEGDSVEAGYSQQPQSRERGNRGPGNWMLA